MSKDIDFGKVDKSLIKVNIEELKACGWEYAQRWIEELREEKHQWSNAFHDLKNQLAEKDELLEAADRLIERLRVGTPSHRRYKADRWIEHFNQLKNKL